MVFYPSPMSRGVLCKLQELDYDIAAQNIETQIEDFKDDANTIDRHADVLRTGYTGGRIKRSVNRG
jgi:hypothetical protein